MNIRQNQLQLVEEFVRLEQHILCQFLPKTYSQIYHDVAPANLMTMTITDSSLVALTNNTVKMAQREQRVQLENEFERYETTIHEHENQYQQELIALEQCFAHQTYNGILLIDLIKNYINLKTENTLRDITHNVVNFQKKIIYHRHCYIRKRLKIDPSPQVMIDAPGVFFKLEHIAYLSRGINTTIYF